MKKILLGLTFLISFSSIAGSISIRRFSDTTLLNHDNSVGEDDDIVLVYTNGNQSIVDKIGDFLEVRARWSGSYDPACHIPMSLLKKKGIDPFDLANTLTSNRSEVHLTCYIDADESVRSIDDISRNNRIAKDIEYTFYKINEQEEQQQVQYKGCEQQEEQQNVQYRGQQQEEQQQVQYRGQQQEQQVQYRGCEQQEEQEQGRGGKPEGVSWFDYLFK